MKRRTPTQLERVARALERYGRVTQLDFDAPAIDGLPPIRRVAARISELRDAGWRIDGRERRRGMSVYKLISTPPPAPTPPVSSGQVPAAALFEPPAPRPRSPYDVDAEATAPHAGGGDVTCTRCDGLAPVLRLPARIDELRHDDGHVIVPSGKRDSWVRSCRRGAVAGRERRPGTIGSEVPPTLLDVQQAAA